MRLVKVRLSNGTTSYINPEDVSQVVELTTEQLQHLGGLGQKVNAALESLLGDMAPPAMRSMRPGCLLVMKSSPVQTPMESAEGLASRLATSIDESIFKETADATV